ncbi:MAG: GDP-mannose mannosyl hydrolase [Deltaproteobacteria bacterium]|nr:GDP-mannose mannosyl hydrolase [Myxococcales bacterium]MDP3220817.1 GDP-mannose mannosyl hydrolase [Deltaproteobacteria bacterium]
MSGHRLSTPDFLTVVRLAPLVSLDLVVLNPRGEVLVGLRTNKPAEGFWFVPGGRIQKDERLDDAFRRLTGEELGHPIGLADASPLGVYEHLYEDNFAGAPGVSTHYVVIAWRVALDLDLAALPGAQHARWKWLSPDALRADATVHPNTRAYFPR